MDSWDIKKKLQFICTDNANNMLKAMSLMNIDSYGCFAHCLNLIVRNSLKQSEKIGILIQKIRNSFVQIKKSVLLTQKLKDTLKILKMEEKKIILDVVTRWNSSYYMLKRFLELEKAINLTVNIKMTNEEIDLLYELVNILSPFEKLTLLSSSEDNTVSNIIPSVFGLKIILLNKLEKMKKLSIEEAKNEGISDSDSEETKINKEQMLMSFISELLKEIDRIFNDIEDNNLLFVSTILDPRYKEEYFESKNPKIVGRKRQFLIELAKNIKKKENMTYMTQLNIDDSQRINELNDCHFPLKKVKTEEIKDLKPENKSFWDLVDSEKQIVHEEKDDQSVELNKILLFYLKSPILQKESNPLHFWKDNYKQFYSFSELAKKYFCFPSSSVASERIFSTTSQIITKRRNLINPKNLEKVTFLRENYKLI